MDTGNQYDGIDEYAVSYIKYKAHQLIGHAGFTESDLPDIEQELTLELLSRAPRFNPHRAAWPTFAATVVDNAALNLIERQTAQKRGGRHRTISIEDFPGNDGGENIKLEDHLLKKDRAIRSFSEQKDLEIDLARVFEGLSYGLKKLYLNLQTDSISNIARDYGVSRWVIYQKVKNLQSIFKKEKLDDYVR